MSVHDGRKSPFLLTGLAPGVACARGQLLASARGKRFLLQVREGYICS